MSYSSLNSFVKYLDSENELIIINDPVDIRLEITEIVDRISKSNDHNKAILFTNTGTEFPLLINAMGSRKRMAMALGVDCLEELSISIQYFTETLLRKPNSFADKLKKLPYIFQIGRWMPKKKYGRGLCQQRVLNVIDFANLPIMQCWPHDGGAFITLPSIHTVHPDTNVSNVGMYRMQIFDKSSTGMHWHKHKTGAVHFEAYKKKGIRMPIAVTLGGDPAYTFSATAPLPENIDEYLLAGFLRKSPVKLVKCLTNDLWIPEDVDFVIEGYIDPNESLVTEGPFGDHTGFYSLADLYPKMHVTVISCRNDAIYPSTIVGIPPMEDAYIAEATERIFTPLIVKTLTPELIDMHMPIWGVAHNLVFVSITKQYEGQPFKVAQAFWGAGQMMFNKVIVVFDSHVNLRDYKSLLSLFANNIKNSQQVLFGKGPIDVLDHSTDAIGFGGKVCFDCTSSLSLSENDKKDTFKIIFIYEKAGVKIDIEQYLESNHLSKGCIIVTEPDAEDLKPELKIWYVLNNIDPQRDIQLIDRSNKFILFVDGRRKKHDRKWPNIITMDKTTIAKVDRKWSRLFQIPFIESPSLQVEKLVVGNNADIID